MTLSEFYRRQLASWPQAAAAYEALEKIETRKVEVATSRGVCEYTLQHNPARVRSTGAKIDAASIAARPCFLCRKNRPKEQMVLMPGGLDSALSGMPYEILVNPFPIFPMHFTIPATEHTPQMIAAGGDIRRFADMLRLAHAMEGMALFYNGAHCGASAPDHFHFQAVERERLPLLQHPESAPFLIYSHQSADREDMERWFGNLAQQLLLRQQSAYAEAADEPEARMNLLCTYADGSWCAVVIPRRAHRPDFYGDGEKQHLLSPASVDLSGVVVVPSPRDYSAITPDILEKMFAQTCWLREI